MSDFSKTVASMIAAAQHVRGEESEVSPTQRIEEFVSQEANDGNAAEESQEEWVGDLSPWAPGDASFHWAKDCIMLHYIGLTKCVEKVFDNGEICANFHSIKCGSVYRLNSHISH